MNETKITVAEAVELSKQSFDRKYGAYVPLDCGKSHEETERNLNKLLMPPKRELKGISINPII